MVKIGQAQRNKRKIVTIISGLATFGKHCLSFILFQSFHTTLMFRN